MASLLGQKGVVLLQNFKRLSLKQNTLLKQAFNKHLPSANALVSSCQYCTQTRFNVVKPGQVSPVRQVPSHIKKPPYAVKSFFDFMKKDPTAKPKKIEIKSEAQIQGMRDAGKVAAEILQKAKEILTVGMTTDELDQFVHEECIKRDAYPSALLYKEYPKAICTSVNNVCCHGIPDDRPLQEGDIVNVDVTVYYNGFHGDTSETLPVGKVDDEAWHLIQATKECRDLAISVCKPGTPISMIGNTIETHANQCGFEVVPHFCGHGIGEFFHGPPDILHFANDEHGKMEAGMTFTIEPILSEGGWEMKVLEDGWTAVSYDDSRSAQFEHTILITDNGHEILTKL